MNPRDRELGMDRRISRRDLLQGMGALSACTLIPGKALADKMLALERAVAEPAGYPPALTGMRGNHVGSYEVAHQLARQNRQDWGAVQEPDPDTYDLVVVGGGVSGLAAAHFYRKENPKARILILENHDDFGGHAKRNEFQAGGRTVLSYGGSQTLEEPSSFGDVAAQLLRELSVDIKRFETSYDQEFFKRNKLAGGMYFNRESWGVDRMVPFDMEVFQSTLPLAPSTLSAKKAVARMPISEPARRELLNLLVSDQDQMPEIPIDDKWDYLYTLSYRDFLSKHLKISEAEVFAVLQDLATDSGLGIEATTASGALYYADLPGWAAAGFPSDGEDYDPYIHHFPDGNASIARLLVRKMIPAVAPGKTMDDVVTAPFDYSKLDEAGASVRLRLQSTVVRVKHHGDPKSAKRVHISYVRGGRAYRVQARSCVLACYNSIIPYLCPELPTQQRESLALQIKSPVLYTTVALRNWQAWKKLGIGAAIAPGSYHIVSQLDFPVSLGAYAFAKTPNDPIAVHMERFPHRSNQGLTSREQFRLGRHELLSTSFETIERNVREQLTGMLGAGGFDPARDIEGITANRWAHGYSNWPDPLAEPNYDDDDDERYHHVRGRKRFGRIAIANCDAAANAMIQAAIEQAHRAIVELA